MSGRPVADPAHAGRLIVAVAVVIVVSLVAIVVSRDQPVRPDLGAVPLPQGSVTHAAIEDCTDGDPPVCTVHLAVGPAGGVELPRATEVMLVEHLRDRGWEVLDRDDPGGARLAGPDGRTVARIADYEPGAVRDALDSRVDEDVERDALAVVTVAPRD